MDGSELGTYREGLLKELYTRRSGLQKDLVEIDQTIAGIMKFAGNGTALAVPETTETTTIVAPQEPERRSAVAMMPVPPAFTTMSTRWAILHLLDRALSERYPGTLSTSEITKVLLSNGKTSEAARFENNVSATLSNMKNPRTEVDLVDGRWKITDTGRSAIQHIRYKNRSMIWNVPINWSRLSSAQTETPEVAASGAS